MEETVLIFMLEIFWISFWIMLCTQYTEELSLISVGARMLAMFILLIGTPFFLISGALKAILNLIFPDIWGGGEGNYINEDD